MKLIHKRTSFEIISETSTYIVDYTPNKYVLRNLAGKKCKYLAQIFVDDKEELAMPIENNFNLESTKRLIRKLVGKGWIK